jgi:hypothetical protein
MDVVEWVKGVPGSVQDFYRLSLPPNTTLNLSASRSTVYFHSHLKTSCKQAWFMTTHSGSALLRKKAFFFFFWFLFL